MTIRIGQAWLLWLIATLSQFAGIRWFPGTWLSPPSPDVFVHAVRGSAATMVALTILALGDRFLEGRRPPERTRP